MRTDVPIVSPDASIASVAQIMARSGLPGVPVVADGSIVGIVTESDLIARQADVEAPTVVPILDALFVADGGRDYEEDLRHVLAVTAGELMTAPVFNIRASATLEQVATLMIDEHVNPVPVVDDDFNLVGIVTRADIVRLIARLEQGTDSAVDE
jgi:CBS domain-containing protein